MWDKHREAWMRITQSLMNKTLDTESQSAAADGVNESLPDGDSGKPQHSGG